MGLLLLHRVFVQHWSPQFLDQGGTVQRTALPQAIVMQIPSGFRPSLCSSDNMRRRIPDVGDGRIMSSTTMQADLLLLASSRSVGVPNGLSRACMIGGLGPFVRVRHLSLLYFPTGWDVEFDFVTAVPCAPT